MSTSCHWAQHIVTIDIMVVLKSTMKTVFILVLELSSIYTGNEVWDDYQISKMQSRFQP